MGEGLDHLHRPALADRLFGYLSVAPRLRYENSWKLQVRRRAAASTRRLLSCSANWMAL